MSLFNPFVIFNKNLLYGDGNNFLAELTRINRCSSFLMRLYGKSIGHLSGNTMLSRNGFRSKAHSGEVVRGRACYCIAWRNFIARHGHKAHTFGTTGNIDMSHSCPDFCYCNRDCFQSRGAIAVDGHTRYFLAQRAHRNLAADLKALLALWVSTPNDDIVHEFGIHFGGLGHHIADHLYGKVV